ncbi:MAG: glycosyltransferase family 4 protein [Candidatus Saccharimonadales bacterium]
MKILFATRNYPPSVGGLQNAAFQLHKALAQQQDVRLVKWGGRSKVWLPFILPYLLVRTTWQAWFWQPDVIFLQDGVMAATMALPLKLLTRKPIALTIHGLDVTYKMSLYQRLLKVGLQHVDQVMADSSWTKHEILQRYPQTPVKVIKFGVADDFYLPKAKPAKATMLLTTGRLVQRKGVAWFVDQVLPALVKQQPGLQYVVIGDGPMQPVIVAKIQKHHLQNNVQLLGRLSNQQRNSYYNQANLFIMPNIPVKGDGEGFGLVALEAASCGTPVVGADLEGIKGAVQDKKIGWLLEPMNAELFARTILQQLTKPTLQRQAVRQYVLQNCLWDSVAKHYGQALSQLSANS